MPRRGQIQQSDFYCPKCGRRAFTLIRPRSLTREAFHKKKLYCPWCKDVYNCIECRNDGEAYQFRMDFEDGLYEDEAYPFRDTLEEKLNNV